MANAYDQGDKVRLSAVFRDASGLMADPTTVTCKVKGPDGLIAVHTYPADVVKDSVGNYHFDLSLTQGGDWAYRWEATGTVQAAEQVWIEARSSIV